MPLKITRIDLENFRSYRHLSFAFKTWRTLLVGRNNAGKSSVGHAILWALTGRCPGLDAAGRGHASLIQEGADEAAVAVDVAGFGTVVRRTNGKTVELFIASRQKDGTLEARSKAPIGEVQSAIYKRLGTNGTVLRAVLDSTAFLDLDHAVAKEVLLGLLNVRVSLTEDIRRKLLDTETIELHEAPGPEVSLEDLEALDEKARARRLVVKQTIKAFGVPTEPSKPADLDPAENLTARIEDIQRRREAALATFNQARGRETEAHRALDDVEKALRAVPETTETAVECYRAKLKALDARRAELPPRPSNEALAEAVHQVATFTPRESVQSLELKLQSPDRALEVEKYRENLAELQAERETLLDVEATELDELRRKITELQTTRSTLLSVLDRVRDHSPTAGCVLNAEIPCKTPAASFARYLKAGDVRAMSIDGEIETLEAELAERVAVVERGAGILAEERELERLIRICEPQIIRRAELVTKLDEARALQAQLTQWAPKLRELQEARKLWDELETEERETSTALLQAEKFVERRKALVEELARAKAVVASVQAADRSEVDRLDAVLADLNADRGKWDEYLAEVRVFEREKAKLAKHEAALLVLEELVEFLGPRGERARALAAAVSTFESRVNAYLTGWGFTIGITPEPWTIAVNGRAASLLSRSERLRLGIGLQLAIARFSGLGFAFIDEAELLDRINNAVLARLVMTEPLLQDSNGQIMIAATRDDDVDAPEIVGLQVFRLRTDAGKQTEIAAHFAGVAVAAT